MRNRSPAVLAALLAVTLLILGVPSCSARQAAIEAPAEAGQSEEPTGARADAVAMGAGGLTAPVLVERELPKYPEGDEYRGIEGDVYIEAVVTTEGTVVEPKLIRGIGNDEMDKRALEAVSKWRFEPGTKDGEPVPVIALFTVTFRVH